MAKATIFLLIVLGMILISESRRWGRWGGSASVGGSISGRNWSISGRANVRWGKKRDGLAPFKVDIKLNPCQFKSYDVDGDNVVTENEITYIFENHNKAAAKEDAWIRRLAKALDGKNADGVITKKEFKAKVSSVISGC